MHVTNEDEEENQIDVDMSEQDSDLASNVDDY